MKRIYIALALCVMFVSVVPAWGSQDLPAVAGDVIHNRDFFTKPGALYGYEHYFINTAKRLNDGRIGVVLLAPSGFEYSLVYDVKTMEAVYKDTRIPEKSRREDMKQKSISVADALKLAKFAMSHAKAGINGNNGKAYRGAGETIKNSSWQGWDNHDTSQNEQQNQQKQKNEDNGAAFKANAEAGTTQQTRPKSFAAEVAGTVSGIIYDILNIPSEIFGETR